MPSPWRTSDFDSWTASGGSRHRLIGVDTPETVRLTKPVEYFGPLLAAATGAPAMKSPTVDGSIHGEKQYSQ